MLYFGSFCDSLRGAWRIAGIKGLDNNARLFSNV